MAKFRITFSDGTELSYDGHVEVVEGGALYIREGNDLTHFAPHAWLRVDETKAPGSGRIATSF